MVTELVGVAYNIVSPIVGDEIEDKYNKEKIKSKKRRIEDSIETYIEKHIKEEFKKDIIKESLFKEHYRVDKKSCMYSEEDKKEFLTRFYLEHKELAIMHDESIDNSIFYYLESVNKVLNDILSEESKIIINVIKQENEKISKNIVNNIDENTNTILSKLDEIKDITHTHRKINSKKCIGFGSRRGICENEVRETDTYCRACAKLEYLNKIMELYSIQGYKVEANDNYFTASYKTGVLDIRIMAFATFSMNYIPREDIHEIIQMINGKKEKFDYIHVILNGKVTVEHSQMLDMFGAKIISESELIDGVMDFSNYLDSAINEYKDSYIYKHYIELVDESTDDPLRYSIKNFLNEYDENAFFILGDYGCGKTSFMLNTLYTLAEEYLYKEGEYIPLFIQLRNYAKAINFDNLFLDFLTRKCKIRNASIEAFAYMQKHKKFVILFDGFDEVAKRVNYDVKYEIFKEICKYAVGNTKIIITSRPNYFQEKKEYKALIENAHLQFEPQKNNEVCFIETYIAELKQNQVIKYIDSFKEELKSKNIEIKDIKKIIRNTHDLTDLAKRPFLLSIILQTLPQIIADIPTDRKSDIKINAASLYKRYIDLWLDRENSKGKTLIKKSDKLHFCEYLSYQMYKEDVLSLHFSEIPKEIKTYFNNLTNFEEIDYFSHDIQSCSFLNSDGDGNFKFIHKSFMEYFVAFMIVEKLKDNDLKVVKEALCVPNVSTEISLFIKDMLEETTGKKEKIISLIKDMLNPDTVEPVVRNNAITLLSKIENNIGETIQDYGDYTRMDFSHSLLKDVKICGVDFSGSSFYDAHIENVVFEDCDFSGVFFERAYLKNVDFTNQILEGAILSYSNISNCHFCYSCLIDVQMKYSFVEKNDFYMCDMSGINCYDTDFINNFNCETIYGAPYDIE